MMAASIRNKPMLPASKAPSCNWIRIKMKRYNRLRNPPKIAAVLLLANTLLVYEVISNIVAMAADK